MAGVIIRRSGHHDRVHFLGSRNLLISVRTGKELGCVYSCVAFLPLYFVEVCPGGIKLIPK